MREGVIIEGWAALSESNDTLQTSFGWRIDRNKHFHVDRVSVAILVKDLDGQIPPDAVDPQKVGFSEECVVESDVLATCVVQAGLNEHDRKGCGRVKIQQVLTNWEHFVVSARYVHTFGEGQVPAVVVFKLDENTVICYVITSAGEAVVYRKQR